MGMMNLLLGMAAVVGVLLAIKFGNIKTILITVGLALGIILILSPLKRFDYAGQLIYIISTIGALAYTLRFNDISKQQQKCLFGIIFPILIYWIVAFFHFPGLGIVRFLLFLTIVAFFVGLVNRCFRRSEMGFVLIFVVDALSLLVW
ncbi:MAG: hypothetical protein N4A32_05745 [Marinifilaceae bacterium]|jgi:hypothetical protein|nr:hypothetical protein [Marinifilaceae bacterium]